MLGDIAPTCCVRLHGAEHIIQKFVFNGSHANGRNIVGQQHATLLGPTCCVRLHGTTTMLVFVAYAKGRNIAGQKPQQRATML